MAQEYVNGDNYEILRTGTLRDGGTYNILDGEKIIILTVPRNITEETIRNSLCDDYEEHQWGFYYFAYGKRNIIPVSDRNIECLENCVKKI